VYQPNWNTIVNGVHNRIPQVFLHTRQLQKMIARKSHLDGVAISLLLGCCLFWGFQQVLVKATIPELPAVFQAAIRFTGATFLLGLWCRWRKVKLFNRDGTLFAGLLAGSLFALEFACLYTGLQFSAASRLTVFLYTAPFWVAVALPLFVDSERLRRIQWCGLLFAFAGVVIALRTGVGVNSQPYEWRGDLLALAGGMLWGMTTVVIRSSRLNHVTPEKLLFYQIGVSSVSLPVLSYMLGEQWVWTFSRLAGISLLLQTVVGAFASYLAWMWLLGRYPATRISVFVFLTPVFSLLFGSLWLKEPVTLDLVIVLTMVATGIVLVNSKPVISPGTSAESKV
jgi:drug/metabolite transporter (DMT)-like permease